MIEEGAAAPEFELPAVVGGEVESIALEEFLGREVVILAFYPGDFNPACDGETTDLDELDLFTMQKDVSVLAVSGDSIHSHRAFADEYDLKIPLLADTHGTVAAAYDALVDDPAAGYLVRRAVVVIGPEGDVQYTWFTEDLREMPPVDRIREAVDEVGGTETAIARYRVGHAHYVEGRRAFTSAMSNFEDNEWMMAQSDFKRAYEEFDEAADHFNTAARFAEDDHDIRYFELAEDKSELLWQAADWLSNSASAYASGEGAEGQAMRQDAEGTLEQARRYAEPPEPDDFPPDEPAPEPEEPDEGDRESFLPDDGEDIDTTLDVDFDEAEVDEEVRESVESKPEAEDAAADAGAEAEAADDEAEAADDEDEEAIDEEELEEITAELEQQTEDAKAKRAAEAESDDDAAASTPDGESAAEPVDDDGPDEADAAADGNGPETADEEPVELELTDPTDGEGLDPIEDDESDAEAETDAEDDAETETDAEGESEAETDNEDDVEAETDDEGEVEETAADAASEELGESDHGVPDSL